MHERIYKIRGRAYVAVSFVVNKMAANDEFI